MNRWCLFLISALLPLFGLSAASIQTDYAIFLFDNGDKNMIASMLNYAQKQDPGALNQLDFRIVFMGPSVDAMTKEPFCNFPDKLIHYKQLGIEESIDPTCKRNQQISPESLEAIARNLKVKQKVWVAVSSSVFEQILHLYQDHTSIEVVALRDNPFPEGDTDYFFWLDAIQKVAKKIAVPSQAAAEKLQALQKQVVIIGHAPTEEWIEQAQLLDKTAIIDRLGLDPQLPIIVYTGTYGDHYEECFKQFLDLLPNQPMQVLIVPHPRYKGIVEKRMCANSTDERIRILGEFEIEMSRKIKTIEAICIADIVVTSDATSTIVIQANALKKRVLYVNPATTAIRQAICVKNLIQKITTPDEFSSVICYDKHSSPQSFVNDVFAILGIPKNGARLLWEEFCH